ncbi:MAG: exonuclease domain-containing protein [Lachnospiraceae bacterium]|nr:exonuclease domain-containing protein [Lachnospiraceae bacterium]
MKHVVVDLEMNNIRQNSEARRICTNETIEIGAVMLDDNLQEIASFRTYVKPEYNDGIVRKISKLTGITDEMVEHAPLFNEAFRMFTNWCLGTGDEVTIYAWSDSDFNQIRKEMTLKDYQISEAEKVLVSNEWADFQKEFDAHLGFERQLSLKMALDMAGIDFAGREHDALDDARNTAELLQIFRDKDLFDTTLRKIKEAMEPTPIGCSIGDMIDFTALVCA